MNERIKQLMGEAVKFRLDPDSNGYEAQVSPEDLEVFAELIVKECAEVAQDFVTVENNKLVEHVHISPWHLQDKIKEHFGVEE